MKYKLNHYYMIKKHNGIYNAKISGKTIKQMYAKFPVVRGKLISFNTSKNVYVFRTWEVCEGDGFFKRKVVSYITEYKASEILSKERSWFEFFGWDKT